jgi:hypothetical protein
LGGWILNFNSASSYSSDIYGGRKVDLSDINSNIVEVPVSFKNLDTGVTSQLVFYAGHIQNVYEKETKTIMPSLDFAIIDATNSVEKKRKKPEYY